MQNIHGKNISDFTKKIVRIKRKYVRLHIYIYFFFLEYEISLNIFSLWKIEHIPKSDASSI